METNVHEVHNTSDGSHRSAGDAKPNVDATSDTKTCQEMEKGSINGNETAAPVRDDRSAENGDATGTKKEEGEQELEKEVEWPDADNYLQVRISSTRFIWLAILTAGLFLV